MTVQQCLVLLWRGVRLRCPHCGQGKLFRGVYAMYERCPHCGWVYEREEGYWTGAMAVNLVIAELIMAVLAITLAVVLAESNQPVGLAVAAGVTISVLLPFLFYRHSKSLWMSLDFMIHPAAQRKPAR